MCVSGLVTAAFCTKQHTFARLFPVPAAVTRVAKGWGTRENRGSGNGRGILYREIAEITFKMVREDASGKPWREVIRWGEGQSPGSFSMSKCKS